MSSFTPGPWEVTGISQSTGSVSVGQRDLRIVIADVTNAASFGDMLSGAMKRGGGEFRQSDASTQFANARLIAAAPDLLSALKAQLAYEAAPSGTGRLSWLELVKVRDAAIAKAEGRS